MSCACFSKSHHLTPTLFKLATVCDNMCWHSLCSSSGPLGVPPLAAPFQAICTSFYPSLAVQQAACPATESAAPAWEIPPWAPARKRVWAAGSRHSSAPSPAWRKGWEVQSSAPCPQARQSSAGMCWHVDGWKGHPIQLPSGVGTSTTRQQRPHAAGAAKAEVRNTLRGDNVSWDGLGGFPVGTQDLPLPAWPEPSPEGTLVFGCLQKRAASVCTIEVWAAAHQRSKKIHLSAT